MATTTTKRATKDPKPKAKTANDDGYEASVPVPSDPRLVQVPDGTATPEEANDRALEKPAPEHVESENKTPTVPPYPYQVERLKARNEQDAAAGQNVEPVGPGNSTAMTDHAAPAGDLPPHEPGTFLHGQTKEQVEATKRYDEPSELPKDVVYVTTPDGVKVHKGAARQRPTTDGGVEILAPALTGTEPKVLKKYLRGEWSYAGNDPQS